jgi:hypothetical protein
MLTKHFGMNCPNDVTAPSSPSLLLRANLLIFSAKLDETALAGRAGDAGGRASAAKTALPAPVRFETLASAGLSAPA